MCMSMCVHSATPHNIQRAIEQCSVNTALVLWYSVQLILVLWYSVQLIQL